MNNWRLATCSNIFLKKRSKIQKSLTINNEKPKEKKIVHQKFGINFACNLLSYYTHAKLHLILEKKKTKQKLRVLVGHESYAKNVSKNKNRKFYVKLALRTFPSKSIIAVIDRSDNR